MGLYATVADMRLSGAPVSGSPYYATDDRLTEALDIASRTIDRLTGFFFELRTARTYTLDGDGTPLLELPAPCITLTSVTMDGQGVDLVVGNMVNRNRPPEESDDFWYPRLEWKSGPLRMQRAFGLQRARSFFWKGEQNVVVTGDFGFVVAAPSGSGYITPPEIKRACMMLAEIMVHDLAGQNSLQNRLSRYLQSEQMGNYKYDFGAGGISSGWSTMTGDPDIDAILIRYQRSQVAAPGWG